MGKGYSCCRTSLISSTQTSQNSQYYPSLKKIFFPMSQTIQNSISIIIYQPKKRPLLNLIPVHKSISLAYFNSALLSEKTKTGGNFAVYCLQIQSSTYQNIYQMNRTLLFATLIAILTILSSSLTLSSHNVTAPPYKSRYLISVHAPKFPSKLFQKLDKNQDKVNYLAWKTKITDASEDVKNLSGRSIDGREDRSFAMKWHQKLVDAAEDWNNLTGGFDGIEDTIANKHWSDFKGDGQGKLVNQAIKAAEAVPS